MISAEYSDTCLTLTTKIDYSIKEFTFQQSIERDVPQIAIDLLQRIKDYAQIGIKTLFELPELQVDTRRVTEMLFLYHLKMVPISICRALNDGNRRPQELNPLEALEKNIKLELYFYTAWSSAKYALDGISIDALRAQAPHMPRPGILKNLWLRIYENSLKNLNQRFDLIVMIVKSVIISSPNLSEGEKEMRQNQVIRLVDKKHDLLGKWRDSANEIILRGLPWIYLEVHQPSYLLDFQNLKVEFAARFGVVERELFESVEEVGVTPRRRHILTHSY